MAKDIEAIRKDYSEYLRVASRRNLDGREGERLGNAPKNFSRGSDQVSRGARKRRFALTHR